MLARGFQEVLAHHVVLDISFSSLRQVLQVKTFRTLPERLAFPSGNSYPLAGARIHNFLKLCSRAAETAVQGVQNVRNPKL